MLFKLLQFRLGWFEFIFNIILFKFFSTESDSLSAKYRRWWKKMFAAFHTEMIDSRILAMEFLRFTTNSWNKYHCSLCSVVIFWIGKESYENQLQAFDTLPVNVGVLIGWVQNRQNTAYIWKWYIFLYDETISVWSISMCRIDFGSSFGSSENQMNALIWAV